MVVGVGSIGGRATVAERVDRGEGYGASDASRSGSCVGIRRRKKKKEDKAERDLIWTLFYI